MVVVATEMWHTAIVSLDFQLAQLGYGKLQRIANPT